MLLFESQAWQSKIVSSKPVQQNFPIQILSHNNNRFLETKHLHKTAPLVTNGFKIKQTAVSQKKNMITTSIIRIITLIASGDITQNNIKKQDKH